MSQVVSKADYARLKNVSAPRVSQWIAQGKIDGDAIEGEGRGAKIRVAIADQQLRDRLDMSQRSGNGLSTRLGGEDVPASTALPLSAPSVGPTNAADSLEVQFKRQRLEAIKRDNRKRAEEEEARAGRFVDSEAAAAQMASLAGRTITIIEAALPEIAAAMAAKFSLPQRDFLHLLRAEFRNVRERAAQSLKVTAMAMPENVEVEIADAGDEVVPA
jgi:hypothetical protein